MSWGPRETESCKRKNAAECWHSPQLAVYHKVKTSFCLMFPLSWPIHRKLWTKTVLPLKLFMYLVIFSHSYVKGWLMLLHWHWRPIEGKLFPFGQNNGLYLLGDIPLCPLRGNCVHRSIIWVNCLEKGSSLRKTESPEVIQKKWEG